MAIGSTFPNQRDSFPNKNTGDNFTLGEVNKWTSGIENVEAYVTGGIDKWQRLSKQSASASATIDFSDFFTSDYDSYVIKVVDAVPSVDAQLLSLRVSQSGVFQSGSTDYFSTLAITNETASGVSGGGSTSSGANSIYLSGAVGSGAGLSFSVLVYCYNPLGAASPKLFLWSVGYRNSSSVTQHINGMGSFALNTNPIDGVQLLFISTGNIASGDFTLYGIRQS